MDNSDYARFIDFADLVGARKHFYKIGDEYLLYFIDTECRGASMAGYDNVEFLGVFDPNGNKIQIFVHSHVVWRNDEFRKYMEMIDNCTGT